MEQIEFTVHGEDAGKVPSAIKGVPRNKRVDYSAGWSSLSSLRVYDKHLQWHVDGQFRNVGPVAAGDTLYVPGKNTVHAFALDGGIGGGEFTVAAKR